MKLDLLDKVKEALEAYNIPNVQVKRLDAFTGDNGVCLTYTGFNVKESYYDGTQRGDYTFAVTVRRLSPTSGLYESAEEEAKDLCYSIAEMLTDGVYASTNRSYRQNGGLRLTGIPVNATSPDKDKVYMWQCEFTADIETRS